LGGPLREGKESRLVLFKTLSEGFVVQKRPSDCCSAFFGRTDEGI
jgi:hypothetical protein